MNANSSSERKFDFHDISIMPEFLLEKLIEVVKANKNEYLRITIQNAPIISKKSNHVDQIKDEFVALIF